MNCRCLLIVTLLTCPCLLNSTAVSDERLEFFEKRIRPVLVEHCYQCHSAAARNLRGGLLLDSRDGWVAGGDSGPAVIPENPADSLLVSALRHESFEMPPDQRLPKSIVQDFEQWIQDGAVDPRHGKVPVKATMDLVAGRDFWSFRPVRKNRAPEVDQAWPQTPIDQFIAARHQQQNSAAAPDASPDVILRRLYFALIGLPPAADEILAFRKASAIDMSAAIASVTDALLTSPRYAERWGRHWLDVTRFAESSGGGRSLMFPEAWRFRDYVIQSFAADKPFNLLIHEHIAGDLLPGESEAQLNEQLCGSAYLALGAINYELQDKELLRMEVIDEQIDTVGRTFLGLTLGCARCHDHKFDPVPTREYYALAGIFRSTKSLEPGNVSGQVRTALRSEAYAQAQVAWKDRQQRLTTEIKKIQLQLGDDLTPAKHMDVDTIPGIVMDETSAALSGAWSLSTSVAPFVGAGYRYAGGGSAGSFARFEIPVTEAGQYDVRVSFSHANNRSPGVAIRVEHAVGVTDTTIDQRSAPETGVFSSLGQFTLTDRQPIIVTIDAGASQPGAVIVDAIQVVPVAPQSGVLDEAQRGWLVARQIDLQQQMQKHKASQPVVERTLSVADQTETGDWHIHIRGGIRNLGDVVPRGFLSVATPNVSDAGVATPPVIADGNSGRRELAEWIASPGNPLTARVYVNRVWQYLIGEGLVRTPDNFGRTGTLPTHPELLDFLAHTFIAEDHWSTKSLIRRITASRVFRMASDVATPSDPENQHLTRGFRRQLDAEGLRDGMLQISGQLDLSITGGRTISKVSTYDGNYDHDSGSPNIRSVYVPFLRNAILDSLDVFDTANPNVVSGRRNQTILPGQALYLMNSPFVEQQARLAASAFLADRSSAPESQDARIEAATLMTLGRSPSAQERAVFSSVLSTSDSPETAWSTIFHGLFGSIDFRFLD